MLEHNGAIPPWEGAQTLEDTTTSVASPREGVQMPERTSTGGGSVDVGRGQRRGRVGRQAVVVDVAGGNPSRHVHMEQQRISKAPMQT
jgi:hypothetical protein